MRLSRNLKVLRWNTGPTEIKLERFQERGKAEVWMLLIKKRKEKHRVLGHGRENRPVTTGRDRSRRCPREQETVKPDDSPKTSALNMRSESEQKRKENTKEEGIIWFGKP
jgi:hypothetical protein